MKGTLWFERPLFMGKSNHSISKHRPPLRQVSNSVRPSMKFAFLALIFVASDVYGGELQLGFYEDGADFDAVFKIEAQADRVISWHPNGNYSLGLERIKDGARSSVDFKFEEIKGFLEREKHKGLVVIWFGKGGPEDDKVVRKRTEEVIRQMKQVGYKRVVILEGHALGVYYLADTNLKSGQPKQESATGSAKPKN